MTDITYVGFDKLPLDTIELARAQSYIERRSEGLREQGATLKVHFSVYNAEGNRAKYTAHLFLEHNGHIHTSDKHSEWDVHNAITAAFDALEIQLEKETRDTNKPSVRKPQ
jgi:ribosome-associated translation inhibitor RaiA